MNEKSFKHLIFDIHNQELLKWRDIFKAKKKITIEC